MLLVKYHCRRTRECLIKIHSLKSIQIQDLFEWYVYEISDFIPANAWKSSVLFQGWFLQFTKKCWKLRIKSNGLTLNQYILEH